jgi:hypothetical protein
MKRYISQKPAWKRIVARVLSLGFYLVACACIGFGQKTCIPPVRGVPGFTNPQPNWWNPGAGSPDYQPSLTPLQPYDPRWVGAASYDYGSGTISDAEFLAESNVESGQTVLYLSWYVKGGPLAPISQKATTLYAGFMPSGGTTGTIIEITLNQFTGADSSGVEPMEQGYASTLLYFTPAIYQGSGTTSWTEATTLPNWLTAYTGVWALWREWDQYRPYCLEPFLHVVRAAADCDHNRRSGRNPIHYAPLANVKPNTVCRSA